MNEIDEIENWYHAQCDGEWEHSWGVKIGTLDNPGWWVAINLVGTPLAEVPFEPVEYRVGKDSQLNDEDWYVCKIENGEFKGCGGPHHLKTILRVFFEWQKNK